MLRANLLALFLALISPAVAADRALFDAIGYSDDGRYFAFEEFGVQDGSGFPFSTIYVVDLSTDRWAGGSPFRIRLEDDGGRLTTARDQAAAAAADSLAALGIERPADLIALNGDGEAGDGQTLSFGLPVYPPMAPRGDYRLEIASFESSSDLDCLDYPGSPPLGFSLSITADGEMRELHRDGAVLPASRGCATGYRIYGVAIPHEAGDLDGAVAIIASFPFGFEGPDRRFLAVPIGAP